MPTPEKQFPTFRERATVFSVALLAMICVTAAWTFSREGSIDDPPAPWNVDGVFYDNIAFNLNQGNGFAVDLQAQPWRNTYIEANKIPRVDGNYAWLMPVKGSGPTTLRSPGYPIALSVIYRIFGQRHEVARIFGCIFVSVGIALLLTFCALRWGYLPAMAAASTVAFDFSVMQSAGTLATESLAVLIFAITFLLVVRAWEEPSHGRWFCGGVSFAALLLTRGIWSLGLLIMIALLVSFLFPVLRKRMTQLKLAHLLTFLVTAIIVSMPWWVRNCTVTDHFTPFGTAGSCGFVGAYCDESLAAHGQWQASVFNDNQREVRATVNMDTVNLAHLEYLTGQASMQKTKQWCFANWRRIPQLMFYRGLSHWGLFNPSVPLIFNVANLWLIVVGLVGCFFCTGKLRAIFMFVLLLDSVIVMLTWEHLGRYAIPIRPIVHLGYGLAITAILKQLESRRQMRSSGRDE